MLTPPPLASFPSQCETKCHSGVKSIRQHNTLSNGRQNTNDAKPPSTFPSHKSPFRLATFHGAVLNAFGRSKNAPFATKQDEEEKQSTHLSSSGQTTASRSKILADRRTRTPTTLCCMTAGRWDLGDVLNFSELGATHRGCRSVCIL